METTDGHVGRITRAVVPRGPLEFMDESAERVGLVLRTVVVTGGGRQMAARGPFPSPRGSRRAGVEIAVVYGVLGITR
jgi:hypothetical protein